MAAESHWNWHGFHAGGILVYEKGDLRAYVVQDSDGMRIAGFEGDGAFERQALEECVERDLRERFATTSVGDLETGNAASLAECLPLFGIEPSTSVKMNRGRRPKWDDRVELRRFAEAYLKRGDTEGLGDRQTRHVMARATAAGVVETMRAGRRNAYRLLPRTEAKGRPAVPGDRERRAWLRAQDFATQLDRNWQRKAEQERR